MFARICRNISIQLFGPKRCSLVVLGHQKSGTTAIAALIARAAGIEYSNDPLYRADWGEGNLVNQLLSNKLKLKTAVKKRPQLFCASIIKDPDLSFIPDQVFEVFTRARVIYVVRDPRQTIRSIADRLRLTIDDLSNSDLPQNLPNRHWRLILEGRLPHVNGHSIAERLAFRWKDALNTCRNLQKNLSFIRYEDFLMNKVAFINNLVYSCGLDVRSPIDQDVDRNFQQPGDSKTNPFKRLGRDNIEAIEAIVGEYLESVGYESWL